MSARIIDVIGELDDLFFLDQPTIGEIQNAEFYLGLRFSNEYKEYVRIGGAICGGGIELTGITYFDRLNVALVTEKEKIINPLITDNMYVVEVVGIDRMVVLQDYTGTIYTAQPGLPPKKFFNSLAEYIEAVGRFIPNYNAREKFSYTQRDEFGQDLLERMENGLIPLSPSGKTLHLHHMGLPKHKPIDTSPLVELESEYYAKPDVISALFDGFDGETNYDRFVAIIQKQKHWNERSELDDIAISF